MKPFFVFIFLLCGMASALAEDPLTTLGLTPDSHAVFKICKNQDYALCATARCFMLDNVAYCSCEQKSGDSISLPFNYGIGKDVCTMNAQGPANKYMISTYSLPPAIVAPVGDKALYDCPAATSDGAYAQCDGGVCAFSTEGQTFPGFPKPLGKGQIICSCPAVVANPATAKTGYQIVGPYPCKDSFFKYCSSATANTNTGSHIYVGAATGSGRLLTKELYGFVPPLNQCHAPQSSAVPN
jgi:hypothetical protein